MPIHIEAAGKSYNGRVALEPVTLTVEDGSFLAIVGASGCGKSTLLNMIAGFDAPSEGRILFDGAPVTRPGPDRLMVFQRAALYPWLSLRDNIAFGPRLKSPNAIDWPEIDRLIGLIGLRGFENHKPYELSGGMQQRVALARVLAMHPRILLMDEPFGALDAQTRANMQELLTRLWERIRATVIFVTHDIDEAITMADRLIVMRNRPGRIAIDEPVPFPRPRPLEVAAEPEFVRLKRAARAILSE